MSIELTWLGHACWLIKHEDHRILLDPYLNDSPTAPMKAADVDADTILVSHGHFDHVADVAEIANRCGSTVVAIFEIAEWFSSKHQVENTIGMNIGGSLDLPFGSIKMTPAVHSSQLPDGTYGGLAAGFLVLLGDNTWPPIEQDAAQWAEIVKAGSITQPFVLKPGETHLIE